MLGDKRYEPGSFIKFHYTHAGFKRTRVLGDLHSPDKHVFVLHPLWNNKMHGIDLSRVTPAEQDVLRQLMDPAVASGQTPARYPLVTDILNRVGDPIELMKQPLTAWNRLFKPFIARKDVYRTYFPALMSGIQVLEGANAGPPVNVRPLFHK